MNRPYFAYQITIDFEEHLNGEYEELVKQRYEEDRELPIAKRKLFGNVPVVKRYIRHFIVSCESLDAGMNKVHQEVYEYMNSRVKQMNETYGVEPEEGHAGVIGINADVAKINLLNRGGSEVIVFNNFVANPPQQSNDQSEENQEA